MAFDHGCFFGEAVFNDGTTQTVRDPPLKGGRFAPIDHGCFKFALAGVSGAAEHARTMTRCPVYNEAYNDAAACFIPRFLRSTIFVVLNEKTRVKARFGLSGRLNSTSIFLLATLGIRH